jgi:sugar lactone lactonase YvrE
LNSAKAVAVDSAGSIYISDGSRIRMVTPAGIISTLAGDGTCNSSGDGGPATASQLCDPEGISLDSAGNLYIADANKGRIRKITTGGIISTVAGSGGSGFNGDGMLATLAMIREPNGVAIDAAGILYIADSGNNRIRKVTPAGIISTLAGIATSPIGSYSGDGGPATAAQLNSPDGVAVDTAGRLYIADSSNNRIRKVNDVFPPTVTTASIASITQTIASGGGEVTSDGGGSLTARGICWSTSANPTTADSCSSNGTSTGAFVSSITGLGASTIYHVRAYAANVLGTAYGSDVSFTTPVVGVPTVTTTAISSIAQTTASGGGNVISNGGISMSARGVCWSTSVNPITANTCTNDGNGTGTFASSITGLTAGTSYHVRAYATNSMGTGYGADVAFNAMAPADFQLGTGSGGSYSAAVNAGTTAAYSLAVTGLNNFSGSLTFACSGLPAAATCSVSPTPLSVSGSAAVPFTVTIATTARTSSAMKIKAVSLFSWSGPAASGTALCLCCLTSLFFMQKRRRLSTAFIMLFAIGFVGCGGGKTATTKGTTAGTYTIVLTATSGSISHSANLTLTVR